MTSHDSRAEGSLHAPPLWVAVPLLCPVEPAPTPSSATHAGLHGVTHAVVSIHVPVPELPLRETHLLDTQYPPPTSRITSDSSRSIKSDSVPTSTISQQRLGNIQGKTAKSLCEISWQESHIGFLPLSQTVIVTCFLFPGPCFACSPM